MNKRLLFLMASLLLCGAVSAQSHFEADSHAQDNNMPVVATVVLDGEAVTTGGYELGAFVGNATEARGTAQIQPTLDNTYWIQVYYSTENESNATVTFKLYDGEDEYTAETTLTIDPEGAGTPSEPVEIVVNRAVTQTSPLAQGWTWWSTYIEMEGIDGLGMLEASLGTNGKTIKSRTKTVQYQQALNRWIGTLTSLNNEEGYRVQTLTDCSYSVRGVVANPEDHPITIKPEWTWIGYPVSHQQTVTEALQGFQPSVNDVIKSHGASTRYLPSGWFPATFTFNPGESYMYFSKANENKTLVFTDNNRHNVLSVKADDRYWQNNIHEFADNLNLLAVVNINGEEQRDEYLELGAFVNGNCRGSSKLLYVEPFDRYFAIMNVMGQDGDIIEFAIVNRNTGETCSITSDQLVFTNNSIIGEFDTPYVISFKSLSSLDEHWGRLGFYPNPINRNEPFNLLIPEEEVINDLIITNALGATVRHEIGAFPEHIANGLCASGVYLVRVICKSGNVYQGRIIVK